jgi:hypothetical protein
MKLSPPRMNSEHQLPLFQTTDILNATPATTRICQFCLTHVLSGKPSGSHHTSVADVAISIGEGCILCGDLYAKLHTFVDFQTPFYTWNIQTSGSKNLDILFEHFEEPPRSRMFHLLHDGNIGNTVTVDELSASTDPWISGGKQIWEWITTCQNDHHECRKASASDWVPTRLLQLSSNNRDMVKLVITKETKITGPYCTLSHSWGITPFLTTTNGNLHDSLTEGIDISTMPKNFRHAIDVARFMKLEYIWIDSLCIIQDGKDFDLEGGTIHATVVGGSFASGALLMSLQQHTEASVSLGTTPGASCPMISGMPTYLVPSYTLAAGYSKNECSRLAFYTSQISKSSGTVGHSALAKDTRKAYLTPSTPTPQLIATGAAASSNEDATRKS